MDTAVMDDTDIEDLVTAMATESTVMEKMVMAMDTERARRNARGKRNLSNLKIVKSRTHRV